MPRFAGTLDRDTWAGTALQWRASPEVPGLFWRRGRFWGDVGLSFHCRFAETASGPAALTLLLGRPESAVDRGYALALRPLPGRAWDTGRASARRGYGVDLSCDGVQVARSTVGPGPAPVLELRRRGDLLLVLVDGRQALERRLAAGESGELSRLGFLATGFQPRLSGLRLDAGNVLDYYFDRAPVDWWIGSGTWELAVRWPCTPEWPWLAGESRQVAALWHKRSFTGDVLLDLHIGPRTVDHGDGRAREICRAFNVVLCGDGSDVRSGYSVVIGADKDGRGATLSRNGQVVARAPDYRILSDAHNQWPEAGCARNPRGQRPEVRGQAKPLHMIAACDHLGCVRL